MKNTPKTESLPNVSEWRSNMKALLIKNGGRIRPIIGNSPNAYKSEVREILKALQIEVKAEQRQIDHDVHVANMPVKRHNSDSFIAGYPGHTHIVQKYPKTEPHEFWCFDCLGYLNYKHCSHVDAVKLFIQNEGVTTLEAYTQ